MKTLLTTAIVAGLLTSCASMQPKTSEVQKETAKPTEQAAMQQAPSFTPEQMKKALIEAATPLPEHKNLAIFTGNWKLTGKMWMDPSKAPEVFVGKSVVAMDKGGKFLEEKYTGKWQGQNFNGTGVTAYNPQTKEYTNIWYDSASPVMSSMSGSFSEDNKTLTLAGTNYCPMSKENMKSRMVHRVINTNEHVLENYVLGPDGKETKAMEIAYKRIGK